MGLSVFNGVVVVCCGRFCDLLISSGVFALGYVFVVDLFRFWGCAYVVCLVAFVYFGFCEG